MSVSGHSLPAGGQRSLQASRALPLKVLERRGLRHPGERHVCCSMIRADRDPREADAAMTRRSLEDPGRPLAQGMDERCHTTT